MKEDTVKTKGEWKGIETFEWMGREWISRPLWGEHHPAKKLTYYSERARFEDEDGNMVLDIVDTPKHFTEGVTKPYGVGYVRTVEQFKYGTFEFEAKLPRGRYVWPALWLASDQGWPPEIDVMEGWTEGRTDYTASLIFNRIRPTMHWSDNADEKNGTHRQKGTGNPLKLFFRRNGWNRYKCVWTPCYVDVYYNGIRIKRFDNPELLEHLNKDGYMMHVIMSVSMESGFDRDGNYGLYKSLGQPMTVRSFRYTPLK